MKTIDPESLRVGHLLPNFTLWRFGVFSFFWGVILNPLIPVIEIDDETQRDLIRLGAKSQARRILSRAKTYGIDVTPLETQSEAVTLKDLEEALYVATLPLHGLTPGE
jgi:hypothetical protein